MDRTKVPHPEKGLFCHADLAHNSKLETFFSLMHRKKKSNTLPANSIKEI